MASMMTDDRIKKIINTAAAASLGLFLCACGNSASSAIEEGMNKVALQEYDAAIEILLPATENKALREEAERGIGLAYMGQAEYGKAILHFNRALEAAGTADGSLECDINYYLAVSYAKLGETDKAIERLDAVIAVNPGDEAAMLERGKLRLSIGETEGADEDFTKASNAGKHNGGIYIDIYEDYAKFGKESEGAEFLTAAQALDKSKLNDYDNGRICYYSGQVEEAANYFEHARSTGNSDTDLIRMLGRCYQDLDKGENASAIYQGFLDDHEDPSVCNEMGLYYAKQGEYDKAAEAFARGISIAENNTYMQTMKHNEIVCREYMGDYETAAELAASYLEIYGPDEAMEKEYAFLITR
ncbi:MAG: tetratricopeptide repeat protein [Lachnospiraceae bacterium]